VPKQPGVQVLLATKECYFVCGFNSFSSSTVSLVCFYCSSFYV